MDLFNENMRPIKFRAWHKKEQKMFIVNGLQLGNDRVQFVRLFATGNLKRMNNLCNGDSVVLLQFIGLKDKNNKEIFEGDIIRSEHWEPSTYQVAFDRGAFYIAMPDKHEVADIKYAEGFEVIGDVYSNPELLR